MRKRIFFVLICSLAVVFTFTCSQTVSAASSSPNNISIQTQPAQSIAQQTQTVNNGNNNQLELAKEQLRGDFYKLTLTILVAFLSILVAIILSLIAYVRWSNKKEYEKAVAEADKTLDRIQLLSDKAENHCEKARDYEQQAHEKLVSIDELVKAKREEMDKQAEDNRKDIEKIVIGKLQEIEAEGKRQRKVSELWNEALKLYDKEDFQSAADCYKQIVEDFKEETDWAFNNWGLALYELAQKKEGEQADKLFTEACEKYQKAIELKPEDHEAFYNWGTALIKWAQKKEGEQADKLFIQACEKYQKAIELKPDYHEAFYNWGTALSDLAKQKKGEQADKLFTEACEKYQKAIDIKPDMHEAFNNWGGTLLYWLRLKEFKKRDEMLIQAEEKLLKAESIKTGSGSYNLACLYGIKEDKNKCRQWLETAVKAGVHPTRKHAMEDKDLKIVKNEEWFQKLRFKGE